MRDRNLGKLSILVIIVLTVILLIGTSFALYNYFQASSKEHNLIAGQMHINYTEEEDTLSLTNAFPMTKGEALKENDNFITFSVSGKNTNSKDLYYAINLNYGNLVEGRTRLKDDTLKFHLTEIVNGTEVVLVDEIACNSFNECGIYITSVPKNTNTEISHNYKLRMWIKDDIIISDSNPLATYSEAAFLSGYASVKVSVTGSMETSE